MDNNSAIGLTTPPWDAKVIDRTWLSAYDDWMLHLYNDLIILGDGQFIHFDCVTNSNSRIKLKFINHYLNDILLLSVVYSFTFTYHILIQTLIHQSLFQ